MFFSMTLGRLFVASIICLSAICLAQSPEPKSAFLLQRKTIATTTGTIAIAAGTRVQVIGHHRDLLVVKANDQEFEVAQGELTDSPTASNLSPREQQEILEKQAAEAEVRYKQALIMRQKEEEESARARKSPQPAAPERQLEEIRKKRDLLKAELNTLKSGQKDSYSPNSAKLQQRGKEIERELKELDQQERSLQSQSR